MDGNKELYTGACLVHSPCVAECILSSGQAVAYSVNRDPCMQQGYLRIGSVSFRVDRVYTACLFDMHFELTELVVVGHGKLNLASCWVFPETFRPGVAVHADDTFLARLQRNKRGCNFSDTGCSRLLIRMLIRISR